MNKESEQYTGKYFKLLDFGYVGLVDVLGSDESIERAARNSYGKGTRSTSDTRTLMRHLRRHKHTSPFEFGELIFHIQCPMDLWRQQIRHRTANVSEYSTRYSEAIDLMTKTEPNAWRMQSQSNKQGSVGYLDLDRGVTLCREEEALHRHAKEVYERRLDFGVAREQARKDLPLSNYTRSYWKSDLHNLLHFITLRCDSHAQLEIRQYANIIAGFVKAVFPITFEAWYDYQFAATTFSWHEMMLLKSLLDYSHCEEKHEDGSVKIIDYLCPRDEDTPGLSTGHTNLSKREENEFFEKFLKYEKLKSEAEFSLDMSKAYTAEEVAQWNLL